ncbi:MAG: ComF family protein [Bacteroidales bacterium]|nr:ComF family protein [Bacteroidales bacterium]
MTAFGILLRDFITTIYPSICPACGSVLVNQEENICIQCLYHLPKTRFHEDSANPVAQMFWGRVNVKYATSMFYYNKGGHYQQLLHNLKYKGKDAIGEELGKIFGHELSSTCFSNIDIIMPVPLHNTKLIKRGYNQSEAIAKGLSQTLNKPYNTNTLTRNIPNESQTRKSKYQRWENVENIFHLKDTSSLEGKHILIVDDIVTTGATLESCARELLKIKGVKVSIATLAMAN